MVRLLFFSIRTLSTGGYLLHPTYYLVSVLSACELLSSVRAPSISVMMWDRFPFLATSRIADTVKASRHCVIHVYKNDCNLKNHYSTTREGEYNLDEATSHYCSLTGLTSFLLLSSE